MEATSTSPNPESSPSTSGHGHEKHEKLGEFASTAICGNDITSSCLYVSAIAIGAAGKLAPIGLIIVALMLYLFRSIYAEVVGALPLNGGAYNALLNTTSKSRASVAACLTILSYMATAVISAGEAMHYGAILLPFLQYPLFGLPGTWWATIALLALFTGLTIMGISESASVAIGIFVTHLVTLTLLIIVGLSYVFFSETGTSTFRENVNGPLHVHVVDESGTEELADEAEVAALATANTNATTDVEAVEPDSNSGTDAVANEQASEEHAVDEQTADGHAADGHAADAHADAHGHGGPVSYIKKNISMATALFFGFAVALLGISGFESSANFVEEQEDGVFPKTLRNMWVCVFIFNPAMAILALALIPIDTVQTNPEYQLQLLAKMGLEAGGGENSWLGRGLAFLVSIDAILVLSGAVLTSFVGVNGLVRRMTLDRCLPQSLLKTNSRGTTHRILIAFFLLCVSVNWITKGDVNALAGVYTISFLTVMALFAVGNILLKIKRDKLPRPVRASWPAVVVAITAVLIGLIGNAARNPLYLQMFMYYFVPAMTVVGIMLYRIPLLKLCLGAVQATSAALIKPLRRSANAVRAKIDEINSQQVVFFTRGDNVSNLNNAMQYVMENEDTNRIKVVTVVPDESVVPPKLEDDLKFLDEAYPQIDIEYVKLIGKFGPELISELSEKWDVPTNLMFIGSPGGKLKFGLAELGGVRLII